MSHMNPVDHRVKHTSTIPANSGDEVELFVREYKKAGPGTRKPVLMLHGRSVPARKAFSLCLSGYLDIHRLGPELFSGMIVN